MRWKQKPWPQYEQIRFHRVFLIFPKRLGLEWRWLEFATIRQIYGGYDCGWIDTYWFDPVPHPADTGGH